MKHKVRCLLAVIPVLILALMNEAGAHPVAFAGGWSLMNFNKGDSHDVDAFYSFTHRVAAGASVLKDGDAVSTVGRANLLLKRWNQPDSQGNVYLSLGAGEERLNDRSGALTFGEFIADWEDRKYYILGKHRILQRPDVGSWQRGNKESTQLRAGFAPYLGEYNELNTWVIAQIDQGPATPRDVSLILRFYYNNVLWEIGASANHQSVFNFMVHL